MADGLSHNIIENGVEDSKRLSPDIIKNAVVNRDSAYYKNLMNTIDATGYTALFHTAETGMNPDL